MRDRRQLRGRMEAQESAGPREPLSLPSPPSPPPPPTPLSPVAPESPGLSPPEQPSEAYARQLLLEEWGPPGGSLELPPGLTWKLLFLRRPLYRNLLRSPNPEGARGARAGRSWKRRAVTGCSFFPQSYLPRLPVSSLRLFPSLSVSVAILIICASLCGFEALCPTQPVSLCLPESACLPESLLPSCPLSFPPSAYVLSLFFLVPLCPSVSLECTVSLSPRTFSGLSLSPDSLSSLPGWSGLAGGAQLPAPPEQPWGQGSLPESGEGQPQQA